MLRGTKLFEDYFVAHQLERALRYTFTDANLLAAICQHESVLPSQQALGRYGYSQDDLAFRGDALMYFLAADYICHRGLDKEFRSRLVSNYIMRVWVEECVPLASYLRYKSSAESSKKRINHIHGTFFEALVYGLFLDAGYVWVRDYLETHYFDMLMPRVLAQMERQMQEARFLTTKPSKYYAELSRVVGQVFGGKLGVTHGLANNKSKVVVTTIQFHVPERKGQRKQHAKFSSKQASPTEALEEVCVQGLRFIRKRRQDVRFEISF